MTTDHWETLRQTLANGLARYCKKMLDIQQQCIDLGHPEWFEKVMEDQSIILGSPTLHKVD